MKNVGLGFKTPKEATNGAFLVSDAIEWRTVVSRLRSRSGSPGVASCRAARRRAEVCRSLRRAAAETSWAVHTMTLLVCCISESFRRRRCHSGNYIDKKCPFTGHVSIRGRILSGAGRRRRQHWSTRVTAIEHRQNTKPYRHAAVQGPSSPLR